MADPIDQIVNVNITATSAAPSRKSFGIPLILAYHTHNGDRVRSYFSTTDMVADGFSTTEPAYLMALAVVSQNPRPPLFKVGRLSASVAQSFTFVVNDSVAGDKVGLSLTNAGVTTDCHHTVTGGESNTTVATAIASQINAIATAPITAVASAATVTCTVVASGTIWYPSNFFGGLFTDTTVSATPSADLAAISVLDNQFYGVSQSLFSAANIQDTAAWVEANQKIQAYTTADAANFGTPPSGIMGTLMGLGYKRTFGLYSGSPMGYGATGLMANRLTADPGTDTWAFKGVSGDTVDVLSSTQQLNVLGNNGNYYVTVAGVAGVIDGRSAQGQYMDIQRGLDALQNDMQTRVFNLLISTEKVPYTEKGIAAIGGVVAASLASFTATSDKPNNFLSNDPGFAPRVSLPAIGDVNPLDKKARILRNVTFTALATGAIQKVFIQGIVNF